MLKYDDSTEEARAYAAAYVLHYSHKDLAEAIRMYGLVSTDHPGTAEAGYALAQVQNIINEVVPRSVLLAAQLKLALDYLQRKAAADWEDELSSSSAMLRGGDRSLL